MTEEDPPLMPPRRSYKMKVKVKMREEDFIMPFGKYTGRNTNK